MPADEAEAETINGSCLARTLPFEQGEYCHLRVGHDRKAADVQDILRWNMYRTAKLFDAVRNGIDVVHVDVSDPHRPLAPVPRGFLEFHHPAHRIVPRSKNRVRQTGHRRIASAPAHYLGVEGAGGSRICRGQLIPDEPAVRFSHRCLRFDGHKRRHTTRLEPPWVTTGQVQFQGQRAVAPSRVNPDSSCLAKTM